MRDTRELGAAMMFDGRVVRELSRLPAEEKTTGVLEAPA